MRAVYVDTSVLVKVAFQEPGAAAMRRRFRAAGFLLASNLLEAEFRAALRREGLSFDERAEELLSWFEWVLPERPLGPEFERVLEHGRLRGADLWHLACALYVREALGELAFLSADRRQTEVASRLGLEAA